MNDAEDVKFKDVWATIANMELAISGIGAAADVGSNGDVRKTQYFCIGDDDEDEAAHNISVVSETDEEGKPRLFEDDEVDEASTCEYSDVHSQFGEEKSLEETGSSDSDCRFVDAPEVPFLMGDECFEDGLGRGGSEEGILIPVQGLHPSPHAVLLKGPLRCAAQWCCIALLIARTRCCQHSDSAIQLGLWYTASKFPKSQLIECRAAAAMWRLLVTALMARSRSSNTEEGWLSFDS